MAYGDAPPLVLPAHPSVYLTNLDALKEYLRARDLDYGPHPLGVTLYVDIGDIVDHIIDVQWLVDQVRFIAVTGIAVPAARLAATAMAVERVNLPRGFPVWRVLPTLAATYTVTLNHDGTLSSRVLEYAVALLYDALAHDRPALQQVVGS